MYSSHRSPSSPSSSASAAATAAVHNDGNESPAKRSRKDQGPAAYGNGNGVAAHTLAPSSSNGLAAPPSFPHPMSPISSPLPSSPSPPSRIRTCLLIIDVQNDFCTGSLKAPDALSIIPVINQLRVNYQWDLVVFSADAHPTDHVSFHLNHLHDPRAKLFEPLRLESGMMQVMWPVHCVRDTWGAALHNDLIKDPTSDIVVEKGTQSNQEFYSAFVCTDGIHQTELKDLLQEHSITHVATCGLVFEYCVGNSALDAAKLGFHTALVEDATRGLTKQGVQLMTDKLHAAHVSIIGATQLEQYGFKPKHRSHTQSPAHQQQQAHVPRLVMSPNGGSPSPSAAAAGGGVAAAGMKSPLSHRLHPQLEQKLQQYPLPPSHRASYALVPSSIHRSVSSPSGAGEYNLPSSPSCMSPPATTPAVSRGSSSLTCSSSSSSSATPPPRESPTNSRRTSVLSSASSQASSSAYVNGGPHSPARPTAAFSFSSAAPPVPTASSSAASLLSSSSSSASSAPLRPRLLLGLSGSVATIKASELLSLLCRWCDVTLVYTQKSTHFFSVSELQAQFGTSTQHKVRFYTDEDEWKPSSSSSSSSTGSAGTAAGMGLWKRGEEVLHVELRKWADFMLVAPLSANTLAKIANGLCDNLLVGGGERGRRRELRGMTSDWRVLLLISSFFFLLLPLFSFLPPLLLSLSPPLPSANATRVT